jgi:uncharacterized membrane protein YdjX (TVP38/TMEM64 family)
MKLLAYAAAGLVTVVVLTVVYFYLASEVLAHADPLLVYGGWAALVVLVLWATGNSYGRSVRRERRKTADRDDR